jgi:two-component system CheB/CheR fusion protein
VRLEINTAVQEITKLLARTLGENISLTSELAADLWQTRVDRSEVENALLNLAINSRDAMPSGGRLVIKTRNLTLDAAMAASEPDAQPGNYVCLSVSDTGMGMSPEVARRAVEPFFTTKEPGKGTGLGLSSVYGFARQSGGHLGIYSEVGKGTTITLYLPRAPAEGVTRMTSSSAKESIPYGDGELVLVVDDNEQVREVTLKRVEALGYAVLEAHDGPSALRIVESTEPIALLLTDVVMPGGMSGYDLVRAVGKAKPAIKCLLASGFDAEGPDDEVDSEMSRTLLRKPYTRTQLAHALRHVLSG